MGMRWSGENQAVLLFVTLRAWGCEKTSDVVLRRPSVFFGAIVTCMVDHTKTGRWVRQIGWVSQAHK